jgi:hypothetical protein
MTTNSDYHVKGPQEILLDLPQERLTSITRGRGPRRGNGGPQEPPGVDTRSRPLRGFWLRLEQLGRGTVVA